jgi:hypothetical protein
MIGHFLQVVSDKVTHVGCALTQYTEDNFKTLLMVCDYSITNICGQATYEKGERECSKCKTGCSKTYVGLCGPNEQKNPYAGGLKFRP